MSLDELGLKIEPAEIEIEYITFEEHINDYIIEDSNQLNLNQVKEIVYEECDIANANGNTATDIEPESTVVEEKKWHSEEQLSNYQEISNALSYINNRISSDFNQFKREYADSFSCIRCRRVFDTKRGLTRHINNCINDINSDKIIKCTDLKCNICEQTFKTQSQFTNHMKSHNMNCTICGMVFTYRRSLEQHSTKCRFGLRKAKVKCSNSKCNKCEKPIKTTESELKCNNSKCNKCKKIIKIGLNFSRYAQCKRCEKPFVNKVGTPWIKCDKCEKPIKTKPVLNSLKKSTAEIPMMFKGESLPLQNSPATLIDPLLFKNGKNVTEQFKEETFKNSFIDKTNNQLDASLQESNKTPSIFTCEICQHIFKYEILYKKHMANHSDDAITCPVCKKKFKKKKYLTDHMKYIHSNEYKYECDMCGSTFKTKAYIALHMKTVNHNEAICDQCGEKFSNSYRLAMHRLKEHPIGKVKIKKTRRKRSAPHPCDMCGKVFKSRILLSAHVKNTSHVNYFKCPACEKEFDNKLKYVCHLRIHDSDAVDIKCDICNKSFKLKLGLKRHTNLYKGMCHEKHLRKPVNENKQKSLVTSTGEDMI